MPDESQITSIAHVIQLSVAPVFLLSGIAALLNVLTNRLSRLVDRARQMEAQFPNAAPGRVEQLRTSLRRLAKRARWVSWGISLCTGSAILISAVVIVLFVDTIAGSNGRMVVAVLFILAMIALTAGLVCFLREIYLATRYLRIGEPEPERPDETVVATRQ
jgi:Na+/melibiose symporter-like transporter